MDPATKDRCRGGIDCGMSVGFFPGHAVALFMQDAPLHGALTAALDLPPDPGHEHGAAADGIAMMLPIDPAWGNRFAVGGIWLRCPGG